MEMKSKTKNTITKQPSKLVVDVSDFQKNIEDRIVKGKDLLRIAVPLAQNTPQYIGMISHKVYDDVAEKNFMAQYRRWNDYNLELLKQSFDNSENEYRDDYHSSGYCPVLLGEDIVQEQKDIIERQIVNLESLLDKLPLIPCTSEKLNNESTNISKIFDYKKVFIVHGHDTSAESQTARFLEQLGLDPIILHEQANLGKTIIEKIESNSDVGFGIVLYTPCDRGGLNKSDSELQPRARQNVVFEHGYLIGKIGRERVCALVKDSIETPGDISGVVYIPMDEIGMWRYSIAKEMKGVGYNIDMNKIK